MTQDTQGMTVDTLAEGTVLTELCIALTTLKKKACHAAAILSDAQKINDLYARKSSIDDLTYHLNFSFLRPDFTLAVPQHLASIVILMREAVQEYLSGMHLGAVRVDRLAAAPDQDGVAQWVVFSFFSGQQSLVVKVPLTTTLHRSASIVSPSETVKMQVVQHHVVEDDAAIFEMQSMFFNAALKLVQNEWSFVSNPTEEACNEARQVLSECLPVFAAARQLPEKYHPRLR